MVIRFGMRMSRARTQVTKRRHMPRHNVRHRYEFAR